MLVGARVIGVAVGIGVVVVVAIVIIVAAVAAPVVFVAAGNVAVVARFHCCCSSCCGCYSGCCMLLRLLLDTPTHVPPPDPTRFSYAATWRLAELRLAESDFLSHFSSFGFLRFSTREGIGFAFMNVLGYPFTCISTLE